MIKIELPFWLSGKELTKLKNAAQAYWEKLEVWFSYPLSIGDPLTCPLFILGLLAYQRDIERLPDEPESLYRKRVKYALVNARDAGSVAGTQRIFERLGIGYVEIIERDPEKDWDVITLQLSDSQISGNQVLLQRIIEKYGRTCRRYEFNLITPIEMGVSINEIEHTWYFDTAS